ncbi:MAG: DNA cytosine methyltransferase, partial [Bacteriovoracaceae bacterium]|nr:DNA cytosine methyltransferase [Bacteriovoracaceae bacterium]
MKETSYKFIDLFSGCGGFSYGLEMAGHKCLLGVDFNADAIQTFKLNHPLSEVFCGDIKELTSKKLGYYLDAQNVDMVVGGPPCQGFSTVGRGKTDDSRNQLFRQFVRIVEITSPKIVIMENVTGLLAKKNEFILRSIFKCFEKLGYSMQARVLSTEEYGVPERRRRTIFMGVRDGIPLYPQISHGKLHLPYQTVADALKNLKDKNGVIHNHDIVSAQIKNALDVKRLKYIPDGKGIRYAEDEKKYLPKNLRFDVDWENLEEGRFRQTKLQRLDSKAPSPTILTSRTAYYHPSQSRYLTAREAAACQSFPNDFIFTGSVTSQFRQIGNAVPPLLGKVLGIAIKNVFKQKELGVSSQKEYLKKAFT